MIRSHIGSTQGCEVVLKLEGFSHLSGWSFGLGSLIGWVSIIDAFIDSRCVAGKGYLEEGYSVPQR